MPLVIKQETIDSSKPLKEGWSLFEVVGEKTKQGKSGSLYIIDFKVVEGPGDSSENVGKIYSHVFNNLGDAQAFVLDGFFSMIEALRSPDITESIERDSLAGRTIDFNDKMWNEARAWGNVTSNVVNGREYLGVKEWLPGDGECPESI